MKVGCCRLASLLSCPRCMTSFCPSISFSPVLAPQPLLAHSIRTFFYELLREFCPSISVPPNDSIDSKYVSSLALLSYSSILLFRSNFIRCWSVACVCMMHALQMRDEIDGRRPMNHRPDHCHKNSNSANKRKIQ